MKTLITSAFLGLLVFTFGALAEENISTVDISIQVPDPGWKVSIASIYEKNGKLLVVCQAKHNGGINAQVISQARASASIDQKHAALPREIFLLGRTWDWGRGYTAITPAQLKKQTTGSELVYSSPVNKMPTTNDFIGMPLEKAEALADQHKLRHRVIMLDGKHLPATRDYRPNRLNFAVEKGKITTVTKG